MGDSNEKNRIARIYESLERAIPDSKPLLNFSGPFQLLVSVILSAQTTDAQVNTITPELFRRYPDAKALAKAPIEELEQLVHSTGFYHMKAKNIRGAAAYIHEELDDTVPDTIEELVRIPGVGRKSANVIVGALFGKPAIIVDTHFRRVVTRLELTSFENPEKIERDIGAKVPEEIQYEFSMLINRHGRIWCRSRSPLCRECPIRSMCPFPGKNASRDKDAELERA